MCGDIGLILYPCASGTESRLHSTLHLEHILRFYMEKILFVDFNSGKVNNMFINY